MPRSGRASAAGASLQRPTGRSEEDADDADWEPLWTPEEVAAYLGVPVRTLYAWRYRGYGPPADRIGKHLRYRRKRVRRWLESLAEGRG